MKFKSQLKFTFFSILLTCLMVTPTMGDERSEESIARWVADRVGMSQPFDMPTSHYVDKATLGSVFRQGAQKTYSSWQEKYGEDEAQNILAGYLENIVGLFHEPTEIIYVADFIDTCSQQAIFAHEMAHYFQHLTEGIIPDDNFYKDEEHLIREMKAYDIEDKYRLAFCKADGNKASDPEDSTIGS